jgi:hypothetical protein
VVTLFGRRDPGGLLRLGRVRGLGTSANDHLCRDHQCGGRHTVRYRTWVEDKGGANTNLPSVVCFAHMRRHYNSQPARGVLASCTIRSEGHNLSDPRGAERNCSDPTFERLKSLATHGEAV